MYAEITLRFFYSLFKFNPDLFIFQASEELEDRESLAVIAAQEGQDSNETVGPDGETFMEKYTRGVSAVETILTLDRYDTDLTF